ncbi:MAG: flavodoxin domain-containing protein [Oscillospiraceae bacterium]|nr:flavodoxin domain-containing protein [Oscillospiraceae bacterium]
MGKVAIIYWSGSGNTEAMAAEVANGVKEAGGEPVLLFADPEKHQELEMAGCDAVAFGCPAMGAEELEDTVFLPVYEACRPKLGGKKVAFFGSYGWGDGEWMRTWEDQAKDAGIILACDSVLCNEAPDEEGVAACRALGKTLV